MTRVRRYWRPSEEFGIWEDITAWCFTHFGLPGERQEEWNYVSKLHALMVDTAVSNGDAIRGVHSIDWKTSEIWHSYIDHFLPPEIKAIEDKYWDKYLNEYGLTKADIFGK